MEVLASSARPRLADGQSKPQRRQLQQNESHFYIKITVAAISSYLSSLNLALPHKASYPERLFLNCITWVLHTGGKNEVQIGKADQAVWQLLLFSVLFYLPA